MTITTILPYAHIIIDMSDKVMREKKKKKKKKQEQKKKIHEHSTEHCCVRISPIQVLTGLALLNFIEKKRAVCFHPIRTDMQKGII